jgi:hypothetical protein
MSESSMTTSAAPRIWIVFDRPVGPPVPSTATRLSFEPLAPFRKTITPTSTARSPGELEIVTARLEKSST